jgi:hypothetical protein
MREKDRELYRVTRKREGYRAIKGQQERWGDRKEERGREMKNGEKEIGIYRICRESEI